ncbi:MAG: SPOR domain-containing protein, partial [Rhizobiales bacterium]|nr:SPOR domain-containing protein [Hyphomicrobiales bacterium]
DSARKEEPRPAPAPSDKPKFTFADEEIAAAKREAPASGAKDFQAGLLRKSPPPPPPPINGPAVTPPRPTLGGEKPIAGTGAGEMRRMQPQLGASTQSSLGYRPLDPPSFQSALKRGPGIQTPQRGLNAPRPSFGDNGFGDARRREQADEYRRRPEPSLRGDDREALRAEPRRGPPRGRRQDYDDDMGDVFEDEAPPQRRRANARDYNQAYQEYDEADRDEAPRRRSSGPLLILLAILVVAGLFVTGLWYYYFHMKPVSVTSGGSVPVITAPDGPAKVNPEPNLESTGPNLAPAATAKKKIYDRILGEADTGGQMVPTEEQPSPVEPLPTPQPDNSGMLLPEPVAPTGQTGLNNGSAATPIPEPAGGQNSGEVVPTPEPLPLPPTPGNDGTQGSMPVPDTNTLAAEVQNATRATSADALSAAPEPPAPEPPMATASGESLAMAEANSNEGAATNEQATPPSDDEPAAAAPEPDEVQPPKAKSKQKAATSTSKKQKTAASDAATNGEPLVLVAPSEPPPPPAAAESIAPSTENVAATTTTETTTSSNSLFGAGAKKLTGKRAENAGSTAAKTISSSQQASTSAQDQVASIDTTQRTTSSALQPEPAPKAKSTTTSSGGTGYVAQVASLRSEAEARAELDRLRGSYGNLIGNLSTRITKATVAGTTRYRLGFGPLPSRSEAAKLCSSLIAAGERDCAVRGL